jgi:putative DNA primase/helicase
MSAVDWLWPNRFAIGELGLLVGLPDEGKGQILCDMAARVTRGSDWPCGEGQAPKGKVLFLTAEDSLEKTVKPRLAAANADMNHVEIIQMVEGGDNSRMFSLVTDLGLLRDKIKQVGDVKLILIDPIASYLAGNGKGKVDTFRIVDVRAAISPVVALADAAKVAVVGVMHFNKKTDVDNVMLRVSDSLAFPAIARHVYGVVDDPKNSRKLFVKGKNNIADRAMSDKTLAYCFEACDVGADPDTGEAIIAPHIVWEGDYIDVTAAEAMSATKSPAARDEAKKFLADILADGPTLATDLKEAAKANGIAERTLKRAKGELGIRATKDGATGQWSWRLSGRVPEKEVGTLGPLE